MQMLSKEVWVGWFSSSVEAYNMALYGFAAPFLASQLFESENSSTALFFSYALVLVAAGLFYPFGALYFGAMGDREGRQKICVYSTLGLGAATGLMGIIPFGEWAWIFFLLLICVQYFFSGGEYYSSIIFSLEHAPTPGALLSALSCLFAVFGIALANGVISLFQDPVSMRLCFISGGMGAVLSYLLKNHCQETPPFAARRQNDYIPWRALLQKEWPKIGTATLLLAFFWVSYTYIFFALPLLPLSAAHPFDTFKALLAYGIFLTLSGIVAERIGVTRSIQAGVGLFSLATPLLMLFAVDLLTAQLTLTACACLAIAPVHSWMVAQFPVETRCRAIFLAYALSAALFAGSTVPIVLVLFDATKSLLITALYPAVIGMSTWGTLTGRESIAEAKS